MANILIISSNLTTWEKNSGGVERTATLAEALASHNVTFLCFSWKNDSEVKKINNKMSDLPTKEDLKRYDERMNDDYTNDLMKKHEKSCESIFKMAKTSIQKVIQGEKNIIEKNDTKNGKTYEIT